MTGFVNEAKPRPGIKRAEIANETLTDVIDNLCPSKLFVAFSLISCRAVLSSEFCPGLNGKPLKFKQKILPRRRGFMATKEILKMKFGACFHLNLLHYKI